MNDGASGKPEHRSLFQFRSRSSSDTLAVLAGQFLRFGLVGVIGFVADT